MACVTFWMAPIGQTQPSRQNPSQASETMESRNRPVRDRPFTANSEAAARAAARNARSRYSCHDARGAGVCTCGIGWLLNSGVGNRSAARTVCAAARTSSSRTSGTSRFTRSPLCASADCLAGCSTFATASSACGLRLFRRLGLATQQPRRRGRHAAKGLRGTRRRRSSTRCSSDNGRGGPAGRANHSSTGSRQRTCRRRCTGSRRSCTRSTARRLASRCTCG